MHWLWLTGWITPTAMLAACVVAGVTRHRWAMPISSGAIVGIAFSGTSWLMLRWSIGNADRTAEIVFLQIAFSTVGLFLFGITTMLAAWWLGKGDAAK